MKTETSEEQLQRLRRLAELPDSEIDTSDIPEVLDWSGAVRGAPSGAERARMRRLAKETRGSG